jgi:S1-C subfamily serine protease
LIRSAVLSALVLAAAAALGAARAQAPAPASSNQQIWCYVESESLLSRKWPTDCKGRVVSDAEARQIQAARISRIKGAIAPKKALFPGKRMIATGSGMVVLADGHVLTNNHVVEMCTAYTVMPATGGEVPATLVAADAPHDLALLKAELPQHGVATFRETEPPPAADIAVVGYPLLGRVAIKPIFVEGSVYIGGFPGRSDRYAINMDVRHGNSGGPVVDQTGSVVGVVVAKINTPAVYAKTGQTMFEVGFAIRPETALEFMRKAGVSPAVGAGAAPAGSGKLLDYVSRYVAQIGCWK